MRRLPSGTHIMVQVSKERSVYHNWHSSFILIEGTWTHRTQPSSRNRDWIWLKMSHKTTSGNKEKKQVWQTVTVGHVEGCRIRRSLQRWIRMAEGSGCILGMPQDPPGGATKCCWGGGCLNHRTRRSRRWADGPSHPRWVKGFRFKASTFNLIFFTALWKLRTSCWSGNLQLIETTWINNTTGGHISTVNEKLMNQQVVDKTNISFQPNLKIHLFT